MTQDTGYLLAHFSGVDGPAAETIRFAVNDGDPARRWRSLALPPLASSVGTGGVRDPFLLRTTNGFVLLATDLSTWPHGDWNAATRRGSRSIVVWRSSNLVNWSAPELIEIAPPSAGNVWAPKAFWSRERECWLVFWSSALYEESDERSTASTQRILMCETTDFRHFARSSVYLDRGHDTIDLTFAEVDGRWYRFHVDHLRVDGSDGGPSAITIEVGDRLDDPDFRLVRHGLGVPELTRGEGPAPLPLLHDGSFALLVDEFGRRGYQLFRTRSIEGEPWTHVPGAVLPADARHGSVLGLRAHESALLTSFAVA